MYALKAPAHVSRESSDEEGWYNSDQYKIYVIDKNRVRMTCWVTEDTTVGDLKEMIQLDTDVPPSSQQITFRGRELRSYRTKLTHFGIREGARIKYNGKF